MKKLFNNDTFLKILSIVLAVLCWFYVVFVTNPQIEISIKGIPVSLSDHQSIKNEGYIVSNETIPTVDIKLRGSRSMLANISKDNVLAYVDLSGCANSGTFDLPITIKLPYEEVSVISKSIYNVTVVVDRFVSRTFPVTTEYAGKLKDDTYTNGEIELSQNTVKVSGPDSVVKTIEGAKIVVDLNDTDSNIKGKANVVLFNSNNVEIKNNNVTVNNKEIEYTCQVNCKKEVSVVPKLVHSSTTVKANVTDFPKVTIIGNSDDINSIEAIETVEINLDGLSTPAIYRANLNIPENITVENGITSVEISLEE